MTPTTGPKGDLRYWSNPSSKATLEGGGSKVTEEPSGKPIFHNWLWWMDTACPLQQFIGGQLAESFIVVTVS
jgi:hypothetical protein